MSDTVIAYKNYWRDGEILASSSEHAQYPVEETQNDSRQFTWRSRHGTGSGNGLFVVAAGNKYIDVDEGGAELTATLTTGNYNGQTLATEMKTQLDAAGALTYTVTYSESTGKFTIAATGNFTIRWNTGTHKATDVSGLCGFSDAANDSGAATYTSDTVVIHTSEYIDCDLGAAYEYDFIGILGHNLTASATLTVYGADDSAFTSNVVSDALTYVSNDLWQILGTARTKRYVRLTVVDIANPSCYVAVGPIIISKSNALDQTYKPGHSKGHVNETETAEVPSGVVFVTQSKTSRAQRTLPFGGLSAASATIIDSVLDECGSHQAVAFCLNTTTPNGNTLWVNIVDQAPVATDDYPYWTWVATLREVL